MSSTLLDPDVRTLLDRLFAEAATDDQRPARAIPDDAQAAADALADVYMPISETGGRLLYSLIRAIRPQVVVEFGTSYGISTVHLAAAVADNGTGHVFGTELSTTKAEAARANLAAAGLAEHATILLGDARDTLRQVPGPIGLLLLDGWKELSLPVLHLLEPRLAPGALVVADDITMPTMRPYLDHVRDPANGYLGVEFPVEDGMEISCRV
ncbi:MAG TPA: class I SAM-dependent methyltransferase [Pseudonocardiaceae bacterium]